MNWPNCSIYLTVSKSMIAQFGFQCFLPLNCLTPTSTTPLKPAVTAVFVFRPFRPHQPTWQVDCLAPWCSDYSDFIGLNTWQVLQTVENVLLTQCLEPWLVLEVFFFSSTSLLLALELVSRKRQVVAAVKKNSRTWGRRWRSWDFQYAINNARRS